MAQVNTNNFIFLDNFPTILRLKESFSIWIKIMPHVEKIHRYSFGSKIEDCFLCIIELAYTAYFTKTDSKLNAINKCSLKVDTLKIYLQIAWENKIISNQQYSDISKPVYEIGKMLGGWKKGIESKQAKPNIS